MFNHEYDNHPIIKFECECPGVNNVNAEDCCDCDNFTTCAGCGLKLCKLAFDTEEQDGSFVHTDCILHTCSLCGNEYYLSDVQDCPHEDICYNCNIRVATALN